MKLIIASANKGKIEEFKLLLKSYFSEFISMRDAGYIGDIKEYGGSFIENALIKARLISKFYNLPALGDDSGLCVNSLNDAPGIYSARYAGAHASMTDNKAKLLNEMKNIEDRECEFRCCLVLYYPDGTFKFGEGITKGKLLRECDGDKGFGYDDIFHSDDLNKSFGRAGEDEKNAVSHRGRALKDLISKL